MLLVAIVQSATTGTAAVVLIASVQPLFGQ
jgi:hypothetical protein